MSNLSDINQIFERCIKGVATREERLLFWEWVDIPGNESEAYKLIENAFPSPEHPVSIDSDNMESIIHAIFNAINSDNQSITPTADFKSAVSSLSPTPPFYDSVPPVHRVHFLKTAWFKYAAILLLLAGTGAYLWTHQHSEQLTQKVAQQAVVDVAPGRSGAILTLADGRKVVLDSLGNGVIANENGTRIVLANGQLKYLLLAPENGGATGSDATAYNTISTPKGRQFQIVLPDGTKVWLNAASTLRYPIVFSAGQRQVDITGEAYFEVAPSVKQPFRVNINGEAEVEVLGTGFNINAYKDEQAIKTTLVTGSVRINIPETKRSAALRPGQQAVISEASSGNIAVLKNADVEQVLAWKNGLFNFEGATLEEVMKKLERWYDIEVVYPSNAPDMHFTGEMSNDIPLSDLLDVLKKMRLHFKLEEGRRLVVTP